MTWLDVEKRQQYQNFMWMRPTRKSEERMINLQRKFLEDLGIKDKETIDKILDENYRNVSWTRGKNHMVRK